MSFARITRQALQPSVLALDPAVGRQQFLTDLDRFGRVQRTTGAPRSPQQYLLDALQREQALSQYDRAAPRLRAEDAAARSR